MPNPYGPTLVDHFRRPRNRGSLGEPTVSQEGSNPLCGDRVRIELVLAEGMVREASFSANACAICVAAASVLTEMVKGAPLDEVGTLTVADLLRALDAQVPSARLNCVRLPLTVLHMGVTLYRKANNLGEGPRGQPVGAVVLAAGRARRFGAQKLLAPYSGATVIRAAVDAVRRSVAGPVVVVVGPDGDAVKAALANLPVIWGVNPDPVRGMSSSLVTGLGKMPPNVGAIMVVLGDQPTIPARVFDQVAAAWRAGGGPIVAPRYRGLRGNPVLFDRSIFEELRGLTGDRGARDMIEAAPDKVTLVDVDEPPPLDVDTPGDYDELLRSKTR